MKISAINSFSANKNTLHGVTRSVLMVARCFGIFPLSGLRSPNPEKLKFVRKAFYSVLCLASIAGQAGISTLSLVGLLHSGTTPRTFYKCINNVAGTLCTLIIVRLAKHWPSILRDVTAIEKTLPNFNRRNVGIHCKIAASVVLCCALLEYSLSVNFYVRWSTEACVQGNSLAESYYMYTMPSASAYVPFHIATFTLMQILQIQLAFVVNFTDVLIIVVSFYLTAHFEELNDLINLYKEKSPNVWNRLRMQYTKLTRLVKIVDDHISTFILFSFGSNMALICVQLFKLLRRDLAHSLKNCDLQIAEKVLSGINRAAYFNFSIVFMIGRALGTAFLATRVHSTAREPILVLYEIPSCCYSNEARRFVEQMHANTVALTGQHFFYVTRSMILSMVATIFTYELVLLQFSDT